MKVNLYYSVLIFFICIIVKGQNISNAKELLDSSNYKLALVECIKIQQQAIKENNINLLVSSTNLLAECYIDLGAYNLAIKTIKDVFNKNKNKINKKNYLEFAKSHQLLADCYDNMMFVEMYLNECESFYRIYQKYAPEKDIYKSIYFAYKSRYYNIRFQISEAEKYSKKALSLWHKNKKDENLIEIYKLYAAHSFTIRNTGLPYPEKFKYNDSINFYLNKIYPKQNIKHAKYLITTTNLNLDRASYFLYKTKLDTTQGKFYANKAIEDYNKAISIIKKTLQTDTHPLLNKIYFLKSLNYFYLNDFKKAFHDNFLSYESINKLASSPNFSSNNFEQLTSYRQENWFIEENYLKKAVKDYYTCKKQLKTLLKMETVFERHNLDKYLDSNSYNFEMYNQAPYKFIFKVYLDLFNLTNDKKYLELAHIYDEKGQYISMLREQKISTIEKNINDLKSERNRVYIDFEKFFLEKNYNLEIFNINENKLSNDISNYLKKEKIIIKNLLETSSIVETQKKIKRNEAILSYTFIGIQKEDCYLKIITKENIHFKRISSGKIAYDIINKQYPIITSLVNNDTEAYKNEAYNLYNIYFKPATSVLNNEINSIIINRNSDLSNIPFGLLLTAETSDKDFRRLPYLIKKYSFRYILSTTLNDFGSEKTITRKPITFLPSFEEENLFQFKRLKEKIKRDYNNESIILDTKCTIDNFKKALNYNDKITVFSHAKAENNLDKSNTGIYFSDGFLSLEEIYKLKSKTDLIILVGCETGNGFNERGEGIINAESAFLKNGLKSVISSYWKIDENSTYEIIKSFNKNLDLGFSKSEALRKAKLDFLKSANPTTANPLYWEAMNLTGNDAPLVSISSNKLLYFTILLLTIVLLVVLFFIKKRL